jgi:DNA modification methylase
MLNTILNIPYTHNFFPYPAKFPPEPIRDYIHRYSSIGDTILDPFCGSGTVLVESMLCNRNAIGIELNPVSALVSKAKSNIYKEQDLAVVHSVITEIKEIEQRRDQWVLEILTDDDIPNYKNINHWFKENMLQELAALRKTFIYNNSYPQHLNELFWMAFLKIIVSVSNQENDTRYAAINKPELINGYALKKFREVLEDYYKQLITYVKYVEDIRVKIEVLEGDVIEKIHELPNDSIDMMITSPPYINTFDYYLYHKHRIFWMDRDPQIIRKKEIGCHHRIDTMSFEKARYEYYNTMDSLFQIAKNRLKKGKFFVMLIGDGIVKNEVIKADELITEIANKNSFTIEELNTISLREVSKGFIKGRSLDRKKHHSIVLKRC